MRRWLVWLIILIAVGAGLMAAAGLALRSLAGGSAKDKLVASLGERMGVPITVASADFQLSEWFRLRPAVALEEVAVGNPPGFRGKNLFEAKRISIQVALGPLLHKSIEVRSFNIEEPRVTVETNARGITNLEAVMKKASTGSSSTSAGTTTTPLAVDDFSISSGSLAYSGTQSVKVDAIDIRLRDFSADRRCHLEASAKFFGGHNSGFKLDAQAGPFASDSLPLEGTLSITIAPAEIPASMRREQFGSVLGAPGDKARATLDATVKGDLYGTLAGPAKLVLTDVRIGKDDSHMLPLSGNTPSTFSASNLVASPRIDVDIPSARLQLGKGEWDGSAKLQLHGTAVAGSSRGSIRNVDINQLVGSFTEAHEKIYGMLEVPSYSMQFAGKNANELRNSLKGSGKLSVKQGRIAALDMVATLQRALGALQQDTEGTRGTTPFTSLTADLSVGGARMDIANLVLDGPALGANGNGAIGFDHSLRFDLTAHVTGGVAHLFNTVSLRPQSNQADVPMTVSGTVDSPRIRPSVRKMASTVVQGLVDSFLKKKQK